MKAQTMWEYKIINEKSKINEKKMESILNDLGEQGWELVSVFLKSGFLVYSYYLKRPKL